MALHQPESMPSTWIAFTRFEGGKRYFFLKLNNLKNMLKADDLKAGDIVAFEFEGNTAVAMIDNNEGYFTYAVGLWFDSNCVGEHNNIWVSDYIENLDLDYRNNLRYANEEDIKRYCNVVVSYLSKEAMMDREKIESLEKKLRRIRLISKP